MMFSNLTTESSQYFKKLLDISFTNYLRTKWHEDLWQQETKERIYMKEFLDKLYVLWSNINIEQYLRDQGISETKDIDRIH